mgnify:FL=1
MKNKTKTMGYLVLIVSFLVVLMYCIGYRLGTCDPHYSWDRQPYLLDGIFFPVLVIFYLLFTHKVKNNKILIVIAVMEMIVVAVLYIAYHTNKLYYEPYWYIHSEAIYSHKVARSLAPEIHFDFWNYIGKVWDGTTQ